MASPSLCHVIWADSCVFQSDSFTRSNIFLSVEKTLGHFRALRYNNISLVFSLLALHMPLKLLDICKENLFRKFILVMLAPNKTFVFVLSFHDVNFKLFFFFKQTG